MKSANQTTQQPSNMSAGASAKADPAIDSVLSPEQIKELVNGSDVHWNDLRDLLHGLTRKNQFILARWLIGDETEKFEVERQIQRMNAKAELPAIQEACRPDIPSPTPEDNPYLQSLLELVETQSQIRTLGRTSQTANRRFY